MIKVGIGGWVYEPWRGTFYPAGLPKGEEFAFARSKVTSIEINATFYRTQTPSTFRKWADESPDGFVFALKGPRYVSNRRVLAEAGMLVEAFLNSGIAELGPKLGPLVWQLAPTKKFDAEDLDRFLRLLPASHQGLPLRHVLEVRHESFRSPDFVALLREHNTAVVYADSDDYPAIPDVTGDFVYARLQRSSDDQATGYSSEEIDAWMRRAREWEGGGAPADLPLVDPQHRAAATPRDCFVYFIAGAKERNPAAAIAFLDCLCREVEPA
jgi:uncharacterized protein YecE (DUF72 family)